MINILASSAVEHGFKGSSSGQVKLNNIKLVFVVACLSMQHKGERAKTSWLRIRIICPNGASCLPVDCCFSALAL